MIGTIALLVTAPSAFKCAIYTDPRVATSQNGKVKVVAEFEGKLSIFRNGSKKPSVVTKWSQFGHHFSVLVSPDGSTIVVHDPYGGLEVFNGSGKRVSLLAPDKFLSDEEREDIPGKWTCHPEGVWYEKPSFAFAKNKVTFATFSGRKIDVSVPSS